eukprot:scaffold24117_cov31-Tisochrysis_lutea.AAC.5
MPEAYRRPLATAHASFDVDKLYARPSHDVDKLYARPIARSQAAAAPRSQSGCKACCLLADSNYTPAPCSRLPHVRVALRSPEPTDAQEGIAAPRRPEARTASLLPAGCARCCQALELPRQLLHRLGG